MNSNIVVVGDRRSAVATWLRQLRVEVRPTAEGLTGTERVIALGPEIEGATLWVRHPDDPSRGTELASDARGVPGTLLAEWLRSVLQGGREVVRLGPLIALPRVSRTERRVPLAYGGRWVHAQRAVVDDLESLSAGETTLDNVTGNARYRLRGQVEALGIELDAVLAHMRGQSTVTVPADARTMVERSSTPTMAIRVAAPPHPVVATNPLLWRLLGLQPRQDWLGHMDSLGVLVASIAERPGEVFDCLIRAVTERTTGLVVTFNTADTPLLHGPAPGSTIDVVAVAYDEFTVIHLTTRS